MSLVARALEPSALALLGDAPALTLLDGDGCALTVRFARRGNVWVGVVDDHAALVDRVRMGLKPRFLVHHGQTAVLGGELEARVVGPAQENGAVVLEVVPKSIAVEKEDSAVGAIPRT
jgi:hypothetical protein